MKKVLTYLQKRIFSPEDVLSLLYGPWVEFKNNEIIACSWKINPCFTKIDLSEREMLVKDMAEHVHYTCDVPGNGGCTFLQSYPVSPLSSRIYVLIRYSLKYWIGAIWGKKIFSDPSDLVGDNITAHQIRHVLSFFNVFELDTVEDSTLRRMYQHTMANTTMGNCRFSPTQGIHEELIQWHKWNIPAIWFEKEALKLIATVVTTHSRHPKNGQWVNDMLMVLENQA